MKTKLALIITLAGCFLCGNILAVPPLPGAIFTTDSTCSGVDLNIYANKGDVYLNGGPAHPGGLVVRRYEASGAPARSPRRPDRSSTCPTDPTTCGSPTPVAACCLEQASGQEMTRLLWSAGASCRVVINSVAFSSPVAIPTRIVVMMIRTTPAENTKSG